jgi:hypothetical protein
LNTTPQQPLPAFLSCLPCCICTFIYSENHSPLRRILSKKNCVVYRLAIRFQVRRKSLLSRYPTTYLRYQTRCCGYLAYGQPRPAFLAANRWEWSFRGQIACAFWPACLYIVQSSRTMSGHPVIWVTERSCGAKTPLLCISLPFPRYNQGFRLRLRMI